MNRDDFALKIEAERVYMLMGYETGQQRVQSFGTLELAMQMIWTCQWAIIFRVEPDGWNVRTFTLAYRGDFSNVPNWPDGLARETNGWIVIRSVA